MFYVYLLESLTFPKEVYVGFSENVKQRLKEHNSGKSIHTNKFKPWKLETCVIFSNKNKALEFEKYLKTHSGRAFRNKRLIELIVKT